MNHKLPIALAIIATFGSFTYVSAAPYYTYQPTLLPQTNNGFDLGTSTQVWRNAYITQLCLSADCKSAWPTGGGAFEWTPTSWGNSTSTILGFPGFISTASSTLPYLGSGLIGANNGLLYSFASSTLFGFTPSPFPFTPTSWGNATGTTIGFPGVIITGSSTLPSLGTGLVKVTNGLLGTDTNTYLTGNQSITLSGVVTGTGATAITTAFGTQNAGVLGAVANGVTTAPLATSTLYGTGSPGQVLMWSGSAPVWAATSTSSGGNIIDPWFTPTTYAGVNVNSTSTPLWLKATSPFSLIASSTYSTFASTTMLTVDKSAYFPLSSSALTDGVSIGTTTPPLYSLGGPSIYPPSLTINSRIFPIPNYNLTGAKTFLSAIQAMMISDAGASGGNNASIFGYASSTQNNYGIITASLAGVSNGSVGASGGNGPSLLAAVYAQQLRTFGSDNLNYAVYSTGGANYFGGNVGIGTTTPNWLLQVAGTRPSLALSDTGAGANLKHWLFSSMGGNLYIGTSSDLFGTSTPSAITVTNAGNVGIASSSPTYRFSVGTGSSSVYIDSAGALVNNSTATSSFAGPITQGGVAINPYDTPGFTITASTTAPVPFTGTTTIALPTSFVNKTLNNAKCHTDVGTLNVWFGNGTASTTMANASTTEGTMTYSANNTRTPDTKWYVAYGTPASSPSVLTCTMREQNTSY